MKKGVKITIGVLMGAVVFYLVYLMFLKKDSSIYVLKPNGKTEEDETEEEPEQPESDSGTGGGTPTPTPTPTSTTQKCPESGETPFTNKSEGNRFRGWVNENYPAIAKKIDGGTGRSDGLSLTGAYNNCYIRQAFYYKVAGGRTLGGLYYTHQTNASDSDDQEQAFDRLVDYLNESHIPYKFNSSGSVVIKLRSSYSSMKNFYYQFVYSKSGRWAIAMGLSGGGYNTLIGAGTYTFYHAGSNLEVTKGKDNQGNSMVGFQTTGLNDKVLFNARQIIKRYAKGMGMTQAMADTIKAY
jgi:hypothetical protein